EYRRQVEEEFARLDGDTIAPDAAEVARIESYFAPPAYEALADESVLFKRMKREDAGFATWVERNVHPHRVPGYAVATISLKPVGGAPGDATAEQMRAMAGIAERHSMDELRITHEQNVVLPNIRKDELYAVWRRLATQGLDAANKGLVTDIIACPGLDYCNLATARSIPVAQMIAERFADPALQQKIGPLSIKISGCINACGHHHVGHIGILGLDKAGVESYQITLGGDATETAAIGERTGPGFSFEDVTDAIETLVGAYLERRLPGETFLQCYRRIGMDQFKETLYAAA
ncbi:MAG: nitrite/sulfite reductase, partial [Pseudomonadota bacterium]